jgi:hypothetical protein
MKTWVGVDNGISGAVGILREDGSVLLEKMPVVCVGKSTFIDEVALQSILEKEKPEMVVFEQGQKNPLFGTKGNFSNGYSFGVVQTVLKLGRFVHVCINPRTWQKSCFKDIRGTAEGDTKGASIEFCKRMYPLVNLVPARCKKPFDGWADALCMAHYARSLLGVVPEAQIEPKKEKEESELQWYKRHMKETAEL